MDIEKIKVGDVIHDIRDAGALREIAGKGLSTNDYTNEDKSKLEGIEADAQKNKIESIKVNGSDVTPDPNKAVNVIVPTKMSDLNLDGGDMASGASLRFNNASSSMVIQPFGIVKESNDQSHVISFPDKQGTVALTSDIPDVSGKQDTIQDLSEIRSGAALGATAYQKPSTGIPASDMSSAVQNSLQLAENSDHRPYNSSNPDGMGYLVLKKNKTFAEQVTEENTIYEIRYDFDLGGESVTIPKNCVLKFEGGSLSNGKITTPYNLVPLSVIHYGTDLQYNYYNDYEYPVYVKGLANGAFRNIAIDGLFVTSHVSYEYFVGYTDDTSLLDAIFGLGMSGNFDCDIDLEQGRIYEITSSKADYSDSIYDFKRVANKTINGNGATIKDLRTRAFFANGVYVAVLGFWQSNNIKIDDLNYRNDNEDWPVGVVYDLSVCGATFIHAFLDCDNFDINISTYGARYGFISGEYSNYWWCGENGLTNSRIKVTSQLTGYPLVVQIGDGLDLWTHSETDHRSNYLMGVRNARVYIESKDHYSAPYACLIGDFRYSGEYGTTLYRGIEKVAIEFNDLGTTEIVGMRADGTSFTPDSKCVGFSLWGEGISAGRDFPLSFKDIIINIYIPEGSKIGDFAMTRNEADPEYPQTAAKDLYGNIHIKSFSNRTIAGTPTRITFASSCIYADVDFSLNNEDIELAANQIFWIINHSSSPVVVRNSKSKIIVNCAGDNIEFVDCYNMTIQKSPSATNTPKITEIASYVTNAANVDVFSGKLTTVNIFPLNTNMIGAKRGLVVLRSSGGLLVWNNGWFSIPLIPVTIGAAQSAALMPSVGQSTQRPASPSSVQKGFPFYDTTIDKPIWQKGYGWIEADGAPAGIKRSGVTAERPTPTIVGFTYFDTDLGKMIVWNGTAWVNMDGSALS